MASMGVLKSRQGAGTFVGEGRPTLDSEPLRLLAALHGFSFNHMFETRSILEVGAAGLAAEHATSEQLATLADEIAEMYATLSDPQEYLVHDIRFHRAQSRNSSGATPVILDPRTGTQFPGNIIPADRINRSGQALLTYFPLPNSPTATNPGRFVNQKSVDVPKHSYLVRFDFKPTENDSVYAKGQWWTSDNWFDRDTWVEARG